jgi:radical SAM superfamily enzyme YgiQ (UPF0313 family)
MYIAGELRSAGVSVEIVDLPFVDRKDWKNAIGYADVYGITVYSSSLYLAKEIRDIVKGINPKGKVVVGGPHPTSLPGETALEFDYVVKGEGEYALHLGRDRIIEAPLIEDVDRLSFPARDMLDLKRYTRRVAGQRATSVTTSRGCPYSCIFCCKDVFGHRVRNFSIERVLDEIRAIKVIYGIRSFIFYDDTFALDRERYYSLCKALQAENITFRCNGNARNNTLEDFKVLYDAGCREIAFGVESGSQKILNIVNKGVTVEQNRKAIKNAQLAGLTVKAFLMIGSPGETRETVEETKKFILEANPDQYTLFTFVPLPGCAAWKDPEKYGFRIVNQDFKNYFNIAGQNEGGLTVETETLSCEDIRNMRKELVDFLNTRGQRGQLQDYYARRN